MHVKRLVASVLLSSSIVGLTVGGVQAGIVDISGVPIGAFPGFGTVSNQNNVINSGTSGVTGVDSSTFKTGGAVTTTLPSYNVDWYFAGAESAYTVTLAATGIVSFAENNQNNNCAGCVGASPVTGPVSLGTSAFLANPGSPGSIAIPFTVSDNAGGSVTNGGANPGANGASLIYSYLIRTGASTWTLTNLVTQWFLFAYNDGGADDNHDDFIGIAGVYAPGQQGGLDPVPLPGALVLFGSALVGMTFLGRRRARKAAKAAY